jgi:transposase InsO family protein
MPDVIISKGLLNEIKCLEEPGHKLLDWQVSVADEERLRGLIERASVQAHFCLEDVAVFNHTAGATKSADIDKLLEEMSLQRERLRERVSKPVSPQAEAAVAAVIDQFPENFRPPGADPCKLGIFRIRLKDGTKCHVALPRRTSPLVLDEMRRQVLQMELDGVAEKCEGHPQSVYAVVMVRHPTKPGLRFCLDARPLNENTLLMPYQVPEIQESLDELAGYKYYCSFDLTAYFTQFELAEDCKDMTAFLVPGDKDHAPQIWRFKRMIFGLVNGSFYAQKQLQEALATWPGCQGIKNFIDDCCIGANTVQELCEKVKSFMLFCKHYNLRLKREKVKLAVGAIRHLGFVLSEEGKSLDPARVDSLVNMKAPENFKALKSLLGSFAFVRGWLADASSTCAPLTDLLSTAAKKRGWHWGPEQEKALKELKIAVQIAPVLMQPEFTLPFNISVDASDLGVGAVLWQMRQGPDGLLRPAAIAYASRRFSERERAWPIGERECFACRYGFEKFASYITQHPDVTLYCDHHNMQHMWACASAKITRWRMYLEQFRPFKIVHVAGAAPNQAVADSLSRLHLHNLAEAKTDHLSDEEAHLAEAGEGGDDAAMMQHITAGEFFRHFENAAKVNKALRAQPDPSQLSLVGEERADVGAYLDADDRQLHQTLAWAVEESEVSTPASTKPVHSECQTNADDFEQARRAAKGCYPNRRIIQRVHDESHPSVATTWARVQRACNFPPGTKYQAAKDEVQRYCDSCVVCQKLKPAKERLEKRAGSIKRRPFTEYAFDVIVLSEPDVNGNRYILTVIDSFSQAVELFPLKEASATEVTNALNDVMCRWTRPYSLRCDNAKAFTSAICRKLCEKARVQLHLVAPYAHNSNGAAENANRRVEYLLRALILEQRLGPASKQNWAQLLPNVRGILNSRLITRYGCTPNELLYGATTQRSLPFEDEPWVEVPEAASSGGAAEAAAVITLQKWRENHQILLDACERLQDQWLGNLLTATEGDDLNALIPGDTVLVRTKERKHDKLQAPWAGPYLVVCREEVDAGHPKLCLQHIATKTVGYFPLCDLKRCNLDQYASVEAVLPVAALDNFEYTVAAIIDHRPRERRAVRGRKAPKKDFEFLVRWADLPEDESNPSWEPWSNTSMRSCEAYELYCAKPEVLKLLGTDFCAKEDNDAAATEQGKRKRS